MRLNSKWTLVIFGLSGLVISPGFRGEVRAEVRGSRDIRESLVRGSLDYIGIPYSWGSANPTTGLDCSAFVRHVYGKQKLGLPRVSRDQFLGTAYLDPQDALPGDLAFFSMKSPESKRVDHVGLYLGRGFFIHASFSQGVIVDHIMNPYYVPRLLSIRRHVRMK